MPTTRRILHLAPLNTSGVPITFVRAERRLGFESKLVTLARDARGYEEDICLELPFLTSQGLRWAKRAVSNPRRLQIGNQRAASPPIWQPHSRTEKWLLQCRERMWRPRIHRLMQEIDFWNFDLYQLEGGLEFFRDGRTVRELKRRGKTIVCLYTGSDLRTRGLVPEIDASADLRLTLEFDHLALDPGLQHMFFPFEFDDYRLRSLRSAREIVIGHAPTNRHAKGSETIINTVESLRAEFPVRLELIEGLPHTEAIRRKADCDVFIDQIGGLGYGVNAIEALAMGICTCTGLVEGFATRYPDHPFVEIDEENLREQLRRLCANPDLRVKLGDEGRVWAIAKHEAREVVRKIQALVQQKK